jgi:hypothetical protein
MKKVKVRIYKDPNNQGEHINKTAKFLQKAKYGMQTGASQQDVVDVILDELTLDPDTDSIAYRLQSEFGLGYNEAMEQIDEVVSLLYKQDTQPPFVQETVEEDLSNDPQAPPLYNINDPWESEETEADAEGWGDELAETEEMKKGGSISKKKFVKTVVRGLKKAAEGMQQDDSSSSTILDTPINGRGSFINNFRRGVKDLGNEYYAKEIYDKTKQLAQEVQTLPPMAQQGMEMDTENPMHHLQVYTGTTSNIFNTPMNQVHGAGYEMPEAKRGREQKQADRANKDFQKAFGDIAAGYMGVPGLPNYVQVISPNVVQQQPQAGGQGASGPLIDLEYKKGPWWSGKREWTAKGVPAEMMMGMNAGSAMPGFGYMPTGSYFNTRQESYTYPGEIVRKTAAIVNSVEDPTKSNTTIINNNPEDNSTNTEWQMSSAQARQDAAYNAWSDHYYSVSDIAHPYIVPSGVEDDPDTSVMESRVWSSPVSPEEFETAYNSPYENLTPEQEMAFNQEGYLTKDAQGNLYTSRSAYKFNPEYDAKNDELFGNYEWARQQNKLANQFGIKQTGGMVSSPQMDQLGNLQKFIYGGDEMNISPIVQYDNNDIQTKDVTDPFMYSNGGLIKADNGFVVQGDLKDQTNPAFQSPAFQQYNQNLTSGDNYQAYINLKDTGAVTGPYNPSTTYAPAGQTNTQTQTQQQGNTFMGYPTAPSVREQIGMMFNPFRNPRTGQKTDFTWLSQQGPATTLDGQPFQPQSGTLPPGVAGPETAGKPGYYYDYKFEKGPWWSGKKTMTMTGRYLDPNNPNANSTSPGFEDKDANKIPDYLQAENTVPGVQDTPTSTTDDYSTRTKKRGLEDETQIAIRQGERDVRRSTRKAMRQDPDAFYEGEPQEGMTAPMSDEDYMAKVKANSATESNKQYLESTFGDVRSDLNADDQKALDAVLQNSTNKEQVDEGLNNVLNTRNQRLQGMEEMQQRSQQEKINQQSMQKNPMMLGYAFGGSTLDKFIGGGNPMGPNAFDPNTDSGGNQPAMGPCTEEDVKNPNSPCYDPNYVPSTPQDFQVSYDINDARTINTNALANDFQLAGSAIRGISDSLNTNYNQNYLAANTTSDNRQPLNELDYRGGYSGLTQRIGSKGQGRGSTGFNSVVGNAAFVQKGGQLNYQKGSEYDLTQEEIGRILAAGGQIEFI